MSDVLVVALAVAILLVVACLIAFGAWKAYTPRGVVFYALMWACMFFTGTCAWNSTWPSSAPRRQVQGIITWITSDGKGRSQTYKLGLKSSNGDLLAFQAVPTVPFFAKGRDVVAITYLDEKVIGKYPRAIGFNVLTGPRAGEHWAVSADWFGPWLGVLLGPLLGLAAIFGAYANKRPQQEQQEPSLSITP